MGCQDFAPSWEGVGLIPSPGVKTTYRPKKQIITTRNNITIKRLFQKKLTTTVFKKQEMKKI